MLRSLSARTAESNVTLGTMQTIWLNSKHSHTCYDKNIMKDNLHLSLMLDICTTCCLLTLSSRHIRVPTTEDGHRGVGDGSSIQMVNGVFTATTAVLLVAILKWPTLHLLLMLICQHLSNLALVSADQIAVALPEF